MCPGGRVVGYLAGPPAPTTNPWSDDEFGSGTCWCACPSACRQGARPAASRADRAADRAGHPVAPAAASRPRHDLGGRRGNPGHAVEDQPAGAGPHHGQAACTGSPTRPSARNCWSWPVRPAPRAGGSSTVTSSPGGSSLTSAWRRPRRSSAVMRCSSSQACCRPKNMLALLSRSATRTRPQRRSPTG